MIVPDIFLHMEQLQLPERVFIFGSGPGGLGHFEAVPATECCLALNSAVTMDREFDWWMAFDLGIMRYPWWPTVTTGSARLLFGHRLASRALEERPPRHVPDYSFRYHPTMAHAYRAGKQLKGRTPLMPGILRGAVTILGCAIQFLTFARVQEVVLVGCDMKGSGHWDGQVNAGHEGVWNVAPRLSWVCQWINSNTETRVSSLSPTSLDIPAARL